MRVYVWVVGGQVLVHEGVDLRRDLDPGGAAANDDEGELGLRYVTPDQGDLLEAFDDPIPYGLGVLDAPHGEAVLLDPRDAEEVGQAAERDDDLIVRKLETAVGNHHLTLEVYLLALGPPEAGAGGDQSPPQGLGHVAGVDVAADDPGHHRPEGEEVVLGKHQDPDVVAVLEEGAEVPGRRVPSEAAP